MCCNSYINLCGIDCNGIVNTVTVAPIDGVYSVQLTRKNKVKTFDLSFTAGEPLVFVFQNLNPNSEYTMQVTDPQGVFMCYRFKSLLSLQSVEVMTGAGNRQAQRQAPQNGIIGEIVTKINALITGQNIHTDNFDNMAKGGLIR